MTPERPVEEADLDLPLAALFAGYALNDEVQRRLHAAGFEGLRFAHGFLIQHLVEEGRPVGELAQLMGVTQQAVSKTVRELEGLGYVERRAADRDGRVRVVTLTTRGRAALETARTQRRDLVEELRAEFTQRALPDIRRRRVRPPP
jgi:DNA-binding MarR family transcriptional regulator